MEKNKLNIIKSIALFSSLTPEEIADIGPKVIIKRFKKNEVILHEEDTNEYMYIVVNGKVKVSKCTPDGNEVILAFRKEGESFGEISLIDEKTMPATVAAAEESIVALIARVDFHTLLDTQKKFRDSFILLLCTHLREACKRAHLMTFNSAVDRIKMLFMLLAEKHGEHSPQGMLLDIKLTHQNIANMSGLTRETVTRVLDTWKKHGDITIENRYITLSKEFFKKEFSM